MKKVFSPIFTVGLVFFLAACTPCESPAAESAKTAKPKAPAVKKAAPAASSAQSTGKQAPEKAQAAKPEAPKAAKSDTKAPAKPQPVLQTVKEWDFVKNEAKKMGWTTGANHSPGGQKAMWIALKESHVDVVNKGVDIKAEDAKAFRATFKIVLQKDKGVDVPIRKTKARLYWARTQDIVKGKHPFAESRAIYLKQADPSKPDLWTGTLSGHKEWNGDIKNLQLRLYAPEDPALNSSGQMKAVLSKCELLK